MDKGMGGKGMVDIESVIVFLMITVLLVKISTAVIVILQR